MLCGVLMHGSCQCKLAQINPAPVAADHDFLSCVFWYKHLCDSPNLVRTTWGIDDDHLQGRIMRLEPVV
jgi:hypothetical protein